MISQDYGVPETPMMRKLREQGREEGRAEGREEGREEGRSAERIVLLLRQLARRCGPLSAATSARVQQLAPNQLLELADALLDFHSADDLEGWLTTHAPSEPG
jgi:predicted transposase YdaD